MDFDFSEEQIALRDLAREILEAEATLEHLKEIEDGDGWFSAGLWQKLADANLLGLAVPEEYGGMGFGIVELCVLLAEVGRAVAPRRQRRRRHQLLRKRSDDREPSRSVCRSHRR